LLSFIPVFFRKLKKIKSKSSCNEWKLPLIPEEDIILIVQTINQYRNKLASGTDKTDNETVIPGATNMRQVYWSPKVAKQAQGWANKCSFKRSDPSLRKIGDIELGENIFMDEISPNEEKNNSTVMNWPIAIKSWYEKEKSSFDFKNVENYKHNVESTNFAQLIWHESNLVGCGFSVSKSEDLRYGKKKRIYVCNFAPIGNVKQKKVYHKGPACSECPGGTECSKNFIGLCCKSGKCTKDLFTVDEP